MARFTRDDILQACKLMGELAQERGAFIELRLLGGAVMAVHFEVREATQDVDALFSAPTERVRRLASEVAERLKWPEDWLNDGAKAYVNQDSAGPILYENAGIRVQALAFEHLLAMKLMAWRDDVDFDDAERLFRELVDGGEHDISTFGKMLKLLEPYFTPPEKQSACYAAEELWEIVHGPPGEDSEHDPSG